MCEIRRGEGGGDHSKCINFKLKYNEEIKRNALLENVRHCHGGNTKRNKETEQILETKKD